MANVYVRSGAAGAGTGADWANAFTTLTAACAAKAAGDIFWVSEDHAEVTAGSVTVACPGSGGTPCQILCANHAGSVPPVAADLATTATISTTGASTLSFSGFFYASGLILQAASTGGAVAGGITLGSATQNYQRWDSCIFRLLGTATSNLTPAQTTGGTLWNNCSVKFAAGGSAISTQGLFTWQNSPSAVDAAGTLPTNLFGFNNTGVTTLEGVDLSALSAKTLCPTSAKSQKVFFKDCKLPASITIAAAQTGGLGGGEIMVTRCDSGATNYRNEKHNYAGDQTTETTIIRTGGASDGTTGVAFKIITTANIRWENPFTCIPISIWNDTTGSTVNVTVCGIWGGGAVPNNDDIWIDVEYLGTAGNPQGSFATSTKATVLTANAGNPTDTSTWGGSTTKFNMTVAITPQQKGPITIYVRCAKASTTFYVDPLVTLT